MTDVQPSLARVVEQFEAVGEARFVRDAGGELVVAVGRTRGLDLFGTTDRYGVAGGMSLTAEVVVDSWLCKVEFVVERAVFDTPTTARVQMEALFVTCTPWTPRRRAPRMPVRGLASVRALWCQSVVDETVFDAVTVALSRDGVVLSTWRALRPADRLWLRTRLYGIPVEAELWVDRTHPGEREGDMLVECLFAEPGRAVKESFERVAAVHAERGGVSLADLEELRRAFIEAEAVEASPDRLGLLKRLA